MLEVPAFVAGLDYVAVVSEAVEQRGGHLRVAEDNRADVGADLSRREKIDDPLDRGIGAVIGDFEAAVGTVLRGWPVVEQRGIRTANLSLMHS